MVELIKCVYFLFMEKFQLNLGVSHVLVRSLTEFRRKQCSGQVHPGYRGDRLCKPTGSALYPIHRHPRMTTIMIRGDV